MSSECLQQEMFLCVLTLMPTNTKDTKSVLLSFFIYFFEVSALSISAVSRSSAGARARYSRAVWSGGSSINTC